MVNKNAVCFPPRPAPRRAAAARTATTHGTVAEARAEPSSKRDVQWVSSRAMAEGQGGSPSTARPPPDACAGLAASAPGRREPEREPRPPRDARPRTHRAGPPRRAPRRTVAARNTGTGGRQAGGADRHVCYSVRPSEATGVLTF